MTAAPLPPTDALWDTAEAMAAAAAAAALPHFRSHALAVDDKGGAAGFDPVTAADRAAEAAMRAVLAERRPQDAVLGEEEAPRAGDSGLTWVIDPIDGTRAFVSGLPVWGTLIALDAGAGPVLGVIAQPYIGERFLGGLGRAELLRDGAAPRPLGVRPCAGLGGAILYSTFPEIGSKAERAAFASVSARARLTRFGCDCYAYALLAMGQIDLVIEAGLQPYDIQGPQAVIEAAGGVVTGWDGGPAHRGGRVVAAGDARVHAEALEILSRADG